MRRTMAPAAAIVAGALALAACDAGEEGNEDDGEGQDSATEESSDAPTEGADPTPPGDDEVQVEGPDDTAPQARNSGEANWSGPPSDQVGVPIGLQPVIVEGDDAVVSLAGVSAYREGIDVSIGIHWDPDAAQDSGQAGGAMDTPGGPMDGFDAAEPPESEEDLPEELLRVELVYPDGSTASSVENLLAVAAGSNPEEPALNPYTGMGDERSWNQSLWAWPLPEEGNSSMELLVDWPEQGIDGERLEMGVDADDLSEAAGQVVVLWE